MGIETEPRTRSSWKIEVEEENYGNGFQKASTQHAAFSKSASSDSAL